MAKGKTQTYYDKNPAANKRRLKQQAKYNRGAGLKIRKDANDLNRKLGTYGNGDGLDASHTGPGKGKLEKPSTNRRRPRTGRKYA